MTLNYEKGGIKIINVTNCINSLKLTWIRKMVNEDSKWKLIL